MLEPADHPGARTPEDDAVLPGLPHQRVDAVHAPDGEHVRRVAAAHADRVLREDEVAQVRRRPGKRLQVRDVGAAGELLVEPQPCTRRRQRPQSGRKGAAAVPCRRSRARSRAAGPTAPRYRRRRPDRRCAVPTPHQQSTTPFWLNRGMVKPSQLRVGDRTYEIFRLDGLQASHDVGRLPYTLRVLLENVLRTGSEHDVDAVASLGCRRGAVAGDLVLSVARAAAGPDRCARGRRSGGDARTRWRHSAVNRRGSTR